MSRARQLKWSLAIILTLGAAVSLRLHVDHRTTRSIEREASHNRLHPFDRILSPLESLYLIVFRVQDITGAEHDLAIDHQTLNRTTESLIDQTLTDRQIIPTAVINLNRYIPVATAHINPDSIMVNKSDDHLRSEYEVGLWPHPAYLSWVSNGHATRQPPLPIRSVIDITVSVRREAWKYAAIRERLPNPFCSTDHCTVRAHVNTITHGTIVRYTLPANILVDPISDRRTPNRE